jgi:hypothetical protein
MLHDEVLDDATRAVLTALGAHLEFRRFYLAGGTALAMQLGHRVSLDLDLFSRDRWSPEAVREALETIGTTTVDLEGQGTFVGSTAGVRVSFFHYPYLLLNPPVPSPCGLLLAGLLDIACMKLIALGQRGSRKDFVDLFFLDRAGVGVRAALEALSRKMPGVEMSRVHIMRSLAYSADADAEPELRMLAPCQWDEVKHWALGESRALLESIRGM